MRTVWTLEMRDGGRWELIEVMGSLKEARKHRNVWLGGYVTRIQKWVKPCKKTHR